MRTIIFKSEKKAKTYEIISKIQQHIYAENELIKKVRTDNIDKILEDEKLKVIAKEIR